MKPDEVIANLVQSNGGPCALDKVYLPYSPESAGPAAKFGLGCELFLPNIDRETLRNRARDFLIDYQATFSETVDRYLPQDQRRTATIKDDLLERIQADHDKVRADNGFSSSLFGAVDLGLSKDDIEPYQAHVLVKRAQYDELSIVASTLPVCDTGAKSHFDTLLRAVLRWCEIVRPVHGAAGFALIFASGMQQNTKYTLHLMKRFPGFDFVDGVRFAREAKSEHNRIKSVNWLTVLSNELMDELGGLDRMSSELEPTCKVHEYPGGVVIQAGRSPELGDAYREYIPGAYQMVARYTKRVQFEAYKNGLFRVADNLDKKDETLAWIRRFD